MRRRRSTRRRKLKTRSFALIAGGLVAIVVLSAATIRIINLFDSGKIVQAALKRTSIVFGFAGSFGVNLAGEAIAARAGLFASQAIEVEFRSFATATDSVEAVLTGVASFAAVDSLSFVSARAKGLPVVAFAASYLESPIVFYALEKSGIKTPQDFIGKRVARNNGTASAIFYDALLRNSGLSRSQIRETTMGSDLNALLNDRVDVIPGQVGREDFLMSRQGVKYNVIRISDYGIHVPGTVYITTEKILRDRPSLVQNFLQSIIAGWTKTYADLAKSVPLILPVGEEQFSSEQVQFELAAQKDLIMPVSRRIFEFDIQQWKQLLAILISARALDASFDLGVGVNYDILREVYRKPITFGN